MGGWRQWHERDGGSIGHVLGGEEQYGSGVTFIHVYNMQCVTVYKVHVVGLQPLRVVWAQVLVFCCIY